MDTWRNSSITDWASGNWVKMKEKIYYSNSSYTDCFEDHCSSYSYIMRYKIYRMTQTMEELAIIGKCGNDWRQGFKSTHKERKRGKRKMNQEKKEWFILKNKKRKVTKSNGLRKTISSLKSGGDVWSTRNRSPDIIFSTSLHSETSGAGSSKEASECVSDVWVWAKLL